MSSENGSERPIDGYVDPNIPNPGLEEDAPIIIYGYVGFFFFAFFFSIFLFDALEVVVCCTWGKGGRVRKKGYECCFVALEFSLYFPV